VKRTYGLPRQSILRATLRREITLVKRNAFIYGFRCACSMICVRASGTCSGVGYPAVMLNLGGYALALCSWHVPASRQ
jgi:hypothetical protein